MNSQDITRALIDTTVARAMVEMDADPKRSVRKLCDLGRQFPAAAFRIRFLPFFRIFCATMKARIIRRSTSAAQQRSGSASSVRHQHRLQQFYLRCADSAPEAERTFLCCSLGCQDPSRQPHPGHLRFLVFCIRGQNRSDIRHLLLSAPLHGSS